MLLDSKISKNQIEGIRIASDLNVDINYRIKVILETRFFTRLSDFQFRRNEK